jgi:hypothetical protein
MELVRLVLEVLTVHRAYLDIMDFLVPMGYQDLTVQMVR